MKWNIEDKPKDQDLVLPNMEQPADNMSREDALKYYQDLYAQIYGQKQTPEPVSTQFSPEEFTTSKASIQTPVPQPVDLEQQQDAISKIEVSPTQPTPKVSSDIEGRQQAAISKLEEQPEEKNAQQLHTEITSPQNISDVDQTFQAMRNQLDKAYDNRLAEAQEIRNKKSTITGIGKSLAGVFGALMSGGVAHGPIKQDLSMFDDQLQQWDKEVSDVKDLSAQDKAKLKEMMELQRDKVASLLNQQKIEKGQMEVSIEKERMDPNSAISQMGRSVLINKLSRIDPTIEDKLAGLSYAQYEKLPGFSKILSGSDEMTEAQRAQVQHAKDELAETKRFHDQSFIADIEKGKAAEKKEAEKEEKTFRIRDEFSVWPKIQAQAMGFGMGSQVMQKNVQRQKLARNALRIIGQTTPKGGKIVPTSQVAHELAYSIAGTISSGYQPAQELIKSFVPSSLWGSTANITQWLEANPKAFLNDKFLNQFEETLENEKDFWTQEMIDDRQRIYDTNADFWERNQSKKEQFEKFYLDPNKAFMLDPKVSDFAKEHFNGSYKDAEAFLQNKAKKEKIQAK